ncbi:MAG: septum formation protein Maf [Proteobacteria bacterium]|nr:septum formation protein Maf [Pseudomonadota bacterium]
MPPLILASTSPWRRRMLESAGLAPQCVAPGVDEQIVHDDNPVSLVRELARLKAEAVAATHPLAWVIGADQVLFDDSGIHGKPPSPEEHLRRLMKMRGQTHLLVTGYRIIGPGIDVWDHETTRLTLRNDLEEEELRRYVAGGEARNCAGGYAIEGHGVFLFSIIDGDYFNVLGLPLLRVIRALRDHGWRYE